MTLERKTMINGLHRLILTVLRLDHASGQIKYIQQIMWLGHGELAGLLFLTLWNNHFTSLRKY